MLNLNLNIAIPEIFLFVFGCVALLVGAFAGKRGATVSYWLVQLALLISIPLLLIHFNNPTTTAFSNLFILDKFAVVFKTVIVVTTFLVFLYSRSYVHLRIPLYETEYYVLGLFSVVGMLVLTSANNFITLFLGLELFSLPVYAMVALWRDSSVCTEAAMKYFVMGAMASGILLYGMSVIYGATRTLDIPIIAQVIQSITVSQQLILVFGLILIMAGIAFKLGAAPFHMWVPDVYEGAPTSVTLFIAGAPKLAGLALAIRLLVNALPALATDWQPLLIAIAILSMAMGNIAAIVQSNLKRMLAYSSISHIGYMLLGLLTATSQGYIAAYFYMIAYVIMTLVAFGMILIMSQFGFEAEQIKDFQGLNSRNPWLAFIMLLVMFSLAGIPPLIGFMAKLAVLKALIEVHLVWLAALALVFAVIGSYYYLKVVKVMYFEKPQQTEAVICPPVIKLVMSLNALLVLFLGLAPDILLNVCRMIF